MTRICFLAHFTVHPMQRDEFTRVILALTFKTETEPATLTYHWHSLLERNAFLLIEEYADTEAIRHHDANCALLHAKLGEVATLVDVKCYRGPADLAQT